MNLPLSVLIAYLLGAVPFGLLVGFLVGKDVREHGSRNIGATNVMRVCGLGWGLLALFLDGFKGFAPVWWLGRGGLLPIPDSRLVAAQALIAFAAILGHTFPVYLKFRGGKGVATSTGAFLALMPAATGIAFLAFAAAVATTRYVSVGSTAAAVALALAYHRLQEEPYGRSLPLTILVWLVLALILVRHRANYARLWRGTENKIGQKTGP
ncbi:MAG: glycerol-3-phosphate 1-O-acyltransferase PlsY [Planctomycetota bacterium]